MPYYPLRNVPLPDPTRSLYDEWLDAVDEELSRPDCDRNELCRRILTDLYYPRYRDADPADVSPATRVALAQMDPRNVTREPEYYHEIDEAKYGRVKPLLWLWEMFDRSPLGENVHLGVRFRRILARRIFRRCGRNFKAFHHVKLSFGYNLEVGDDVVIHRHVLLDDRGGIRMGDRVSVSDFANIYSHTHDVDHLPRHRSGRCPRGRGLHGGRHGPGHPGHRSPPRPRRHSRPTRDQEARGPGTGTRPRRSPGRRELEADDR